MRVSLPGRSILVLSILVVLVVGCTPLVTRHSPTSRIGGRLYRDTRRADVLGLTPGAALSSGSVREGDLARAFSENAPTSKLETATTLKEAANPGAGDPGSADPKEIGDQRPNSDRDERFLENLRQRYSSLVEDLWSPESPTTWIRPFHDAELRLFYVEEPFSTFNDQGRQLEEGFNLHLSDRAVLRAYDHLLLSAEPELSFIETEDRDVNGRARDQETTLRFQELSASARWGGGEITVGRMPLWWGPGRHGSLLISNNARPFDMIRLGTGGPQLLPGFLGYLGLVQLETIFTRLEQSRAISDPYLWGMRVSSRVNPYLEIGASRTAQFGGEGRSVSLGTIYNVWRADTENDVDDPGNQLASIDARVIVPWSIQPFELYTEYGGADEANGFLSKEAFIVGLYFPRIGSCDLFELTFEFANTTVSGDREIWYTSRNYPDGYTYHERIIGHHVGTDGLDAFAELRVHACDGLDLSFAVDYEEHFRRAPVLESVFQTRIGIEKRVWKSLWIVARFGVDAWKNVAQQQGDDEIGYGIGIGGRWEP